MPGYINGTLLPVLAMEPNVGVGYISGQCPCSDVVFLARKLMIASPEITLHQLNVPMLNVSINF